MARRHPSRRGAIAHPATRVMLIRQVHAYLSVFVAPIILFFASTGILQIYGLHEAHAGYQPPALIEKLGRLHKDQTYSLGRKHLAAAPSGPSSSLAAPARPPAADGDWVKPLTKSDQGDHDGASSKTQVLKGLFCAAAVVLIVSVLLGVWMAVTQNRRKVVLLVVLLLGAAAPVAILLL